MMHNSVQLLDVCGDDAYCTSYSAVIDASSVDGDSYGKGVCLPSPTCPSGACAEPAEIEE